jgi:hypothetical protein
MYLPKGPELEAAGADGGDMGSIARRSNGCKLAETLAQIGMVFAPATAEAPRIWMATAHAPIRAAHGLSAHQLVRRGRQKPEQTLGSVAFGAFRKVAHLSERYLPGQGDGVDLSSCQARLDTLPRLGAPGVNSARDRGRMATRPAPAGLQ